MDQFSGLFIARNYKSELFDSILDIEFDDSDIFRYSGGSSSSSSSSSSFSSSSSSSSSASVPSKTSSGMHRVNLRGDYPTRSAGVLVPLRGTPLILISYFVSAVTLIY